MSVTVRKYKRGGWHVDVIVRLPSAERLRERPLLKVISKTAAREWGEARELYLLQHGPKQRHKEVPTLEQFAPRFLDGYVRANRQKPSGIAAKETILNTHLVPLLGSKRLDAITSEQVQELKHGLKHRAPKTVNNVLTVLNVMLKKAVEWEVIERLSCTIRLLPIPKPSASFHDFDEYERLVAAAKATDAQAYLVVLLGGEGGLRCGEMMALEWADVDLAKRQLCVQRSEWKSHVTTPKSGRLRYVPLTTRLAAALRDERHLKGSRVLCENDGAPLTMRAVQGLVLRAARRASLRNGGVVHLLRHTSARIWRCVGH